jgi:hypothetical protein
MLYNYSLKTRNRAGGIHMTEKQLKALEKRIQVIEDIQAINDLKAAYAAVCDDRYNPPKAVKLFTEDAVWDGGKDFGVHRGRDAIKKFFEGVAQNIVFAVHYFLQPVIKINKDGKTATGRWYLWQACTLKGGVGTWIAGLEFDKYRKVNGKWLMSEMKLKLFL